ncbi:DUF5989 family protein [Geothermobacter hydrogeniphilus]|uniref:DUF5989 family protein n=1 Tax=Geothermobacter hydrogeniphilus TaxID=1969733 RepID=UPI001555E016|nr:DUF5989 family protein [Geothermobacter hydrogeniphilus]
MMRGFETLRELSRFLLERKKFVLAPLVLALVLMSALILLAEIPVLTPFIYALF